MQHITAGNLAHAYIHTYIYELLAEKHRTSAAHNIRQLETHTCMYSNDRQRGTVAEHNMSFIYI